MLFSWLLARKLVWYGLNGLTGCVWRRWIASKFSLFIFWGFVWHLCWMFCPLNLPASSCMLILPGLASSAKLVSKDVLNSLGSVGVWCANVAERPGDKLVAIPVAGAPPPLNLEKSISHVLYPPLITEDPALSLAEPRSVVMSGVADSLDYNA